MFNVGAGGVTVIDAENGNGRLSSNFCLDCCVYVRIYALEISYQIHRQLDMNRLIYDTERYGQTAI